MTPGRFGVTKPGSCHVTERVVRCTMAVMARRSTTVRLDEDLLSAVEDAAARAGKSPQDIIASAVRARFTAEQVLDELWAGLSDSDLTEEGSLDLAYSELRAMRAESDHQAAS